MGLRACGVGVAVAAILAYAAIEYVRRPHIPAHLLRHPIVVVPDLLSPEQGSRLLALVKRLKDYPVVTSAEGGFYNMSHEHIGEAQPASVGGRCVHPYLVPSADRTLCVLPGRVDVGRHLLLSGGPDGLKERHSTVVSRVLSFMRYHFDPQAFPEVKELFDSPGFVAAAEAVCPPDKRVLDPFQFNFIIQVPGQTVATHIDAVYFWGADRFHVPQWLLAVMAFSGLWQDRFVDQVQLVAYLHGSEATSPGAGGRFLFWETEAAVPSAVPATPLSGIAVDGSKLVHAAEVFQPRAAPPLLDKSRRNALGYDAAADEWRLTADGEPIEGARAYRTPELRISLVYRARCFESEERRAAFAAQRRSSRAATNDDLLGDAEPGAEGAEGSDMIPLEGRGGILDTLIADLAARGRVRDRTALDAIPRLDLAMTLLQEYISYPVSATALIPWNLCVAAGLAPEWPAGLADLACGPDPGAAAAAPAPAA